MPTAQSALKRDPDQPYHVLVVDDELPNAKALKRWLQRRGFRASTALSAAEGHECIRTDPPDLLLLDIMMPVQSGLDLLALLRSDSETSQLPVILVSAMNDSADIVRGLRIGADDYVTKPIDFPILLARIEARLKRARVQQSTDRQAALLTRMSEVDEALAKSFEADARSPVAEAPTEGRHLEAWERGPTVRRNLTDQAQDRDTGDYFAVGESPATIDRDDNDGQLLADIAEELLVSRDQNRTLGLLVLQPDRLDHLKNRFGREVGIELIGKVVQRLATMLPARAALHRVRGTVLCAIVPGLTPDGLVALAERASLVVTASPFPTVVGPFTLGVDIGVAVCWPDSATTARELFARAQSAYEHARRNARSGIWMARREGILTPHGPYRVRLPADG